MKKIAHIYTFIITPFEQQYQRYTSIIAGITNPVPVVLASPSLYYEEKTQKDEERERRGGDGG